MPSRTHIRNSHVAAAATLCLSLGWTLSAQSYTPLYGPATVNSQQWVCIDESTGYPVPGAQWWIYNGGAAYYFHTNDHLHDSPSHPVSGISPTSGTADGNGNFSFSLYPSYVGQAEAYYLYCGADGYIADNVLFEYAVGYTIYWVDHPGIQYQIGGNAPGMHGDNTGNHWMQSAPAYGVYYTAVAWINDQNPGQQICVNDMALPFGGKFDIDDTWTSPHASHDYGSAVDVATTTNQCPSAYVITNPSLFLSYCVNNGALPYPTSQIDPSDVHCNWVNPATYPH